MSGMESGDCSRGSQWNRGEIDGLFCPICMDAWTDNGDHHISFVFKQLKEQDVSQAEKLTTEGLRPGERLKQLQEQEARRRQQREEEKGNVVESAARGSQVTNGKPRSLTGQETSNVGVVNGGPSSQEFKEDTNSIPVFRTENSEASDNSEVNGRDDQKPYENLEAVEVHSTSVTPDNKLSEENTHQAERE